MTKVKKTLETKKTSSSKAIGPLEEFYGFKVLPVITKDGVRHFMYMTKHEVRSVVDTLPADRTLFLVNLPADTTDAHLQYLFRSHGTVVKIVYYGITATNATSNTTRSVTPVLLQEDTDEDTEVGTTHVSILVSEKKKKQYAKGKKSKTQQDEKEQPEASDKARLRRILHSGATAHIVFDKAESLANVLGMNRIIRKWEVDQEHSKLQPLGFERHMLAFELSRPEHDDLQRQVDSYMMKFKENEYQKERQLLERMNKMDEDGFVVVSRHKKKKNTDGEIHVTAASSAAVEAYDPSRTKKKELMDFYRFQLREKKQNELLELRKRFEEDKLKIDKLKQSRRFRPY